MDVHSVRAGYSDLFARSLGAQGVAGDPNVLFSVDFFPILPEHRKRPMERSDRLGGGGLVTLGKWQIVYT